MQIPKSGKPLVPDVIGRDLPAAVLRYPLEGLCARLGCTFIQDEVTALECDNRRIVTTVRQLPFDYALIASGSETNFYGDTRVRARALKLDDTADAECLRQRLETQVSRAYVIAGAGYTGVEIATCIRRFLMKRSFAAPVVMIEKAPQILGPLPQWMKTHVLTQLARMDIQVMTGVSLASFDDATIALSNKQQFTDATLIWAAGVKTPSFVQGLPFEKSPQGRLRVDEYLRVGTGLFAAGDSALFTSGGTALRMGVQFSIMQGRLAAGNIIRSCLNRPLKRYRPVDFGYIIPLANNDSCGIICGLDLSGITPTLMHYLMCTYRTAGLKNKVGLLANLELS